jgi:hypothetical protein
MGNDGVTPRVSLGVNRHDKGWPKVQLLTWVTVTDQTWRYCIEPMGYRDTIWERSGYVELIRFGLRVRGVRADLCMPPLPVGPGDNLEGEA